MTESERNDTMVKQLVYAAKLFKSKKTDDAGLVAHFKSCIEWYEQSRQAAVSGSVLEKIRQAFADYYKSEGCSCCRNESKHDEAEKKLAELLKPDMYKDGSGYNWYLYASTDR